jgi:hypothetical protein
MKRSARDSRCRTNGYYVDFPKRSLHGGFAKTIKIPREFQQREPDKKKIRGLALFQEQKARKNAVFPVPKEAQIARIRTQNGGKRRQRTRLLLLRKRSGRQRAEG